MFLPYALMPRAIYWLASVLLVWLLMQAVHESGHVLGAWLTGGHITTVVLHPLAISRTDASPNPHPLIEVWAGPLVGVLFPVVAWRISLPGLRGGLVSWLRFFAGFCLIANGCYLGYGVIEPIGDAEELVRLGTPPWTLGLFALLTVSLGLSLWHGLGAEFGLGPNGKLISWTTALIACSTLLAVIILEFTLSPSS